MESILKERVKSNDKSSPMLNLKLKQEDKLKVIIPKDSRNCLRTENTKSPIKGLLTKRDTTGREKRIITEEHNSYNGSEATYINFVPKVTIVNNASKQTSDLGASYKPYHHEKNVQQIAQTSS